MADDFDLDGWLDDYQPLVTEARVVQKASLVAKHARLDQAYMVARTNAGDVMHDPAIAEAERALLDCEDELAASEKVFTFQSTGHEAWQTLKRKHPPSAEDRDADTDVCMETFAPAAIALFSHDPKITQTQAETMQRKLPPGEFAKVYRAVLEANGEVLGAPKSVLAALTARMRKRGDYSTTEPPTESPGDDSSATLADRSPE